MGIFVLFLNSGEKLVDIYHVSYNLFLNGLCCVRRIFPLFLVFWVFIMKGCWVLSLPFLYQLSQLSWLCGVYPLCSNVVYYINWFSSAELPLYSEINPTWIQLAGILVCCVFVFICLSEFINFPLWPTGCWRVCCLISTYLWIFLAVQISSVFPLWPEKVLSITLILSLKLVLWSTRWSFLEVFPCVLEKNLYSTDWGGVFHVCLLGAAGL